MPPTFDFQAFQTALNQLMNASDTEEIAEIAAENPILMSDEADAAFEMLIRAQEDENAAEWLGQMREMMQMLGQSPGMKDEVSGIQTAVRKLMATSTPQEGAKVIQTHPELLSDDAERLFDLLIKTAREQGDEASAQAIESRRAFVQVVREAMDEEDEEEEESPASLSQGCDRLTHAPLRQTDAHTNP